MGVVEVDQRVELDRLIAPLALDARPELGRYARRLMDVSGEDLVILIHVRDPLTVGQQKGLSGLGKHPKGRITTSNPGLLGCSSSGGDTAEHPRAGAHVAQQRERDWRVTADR